MPLRLLFRRAFGPLFATQFCGAFNDNLFKSAFMLMVAFQGRSVGGLPPGLMLNLVAAVFILPFLLFSVTAGECADKWDKARITRLLKLVEVGLMTFGGWGLYAHQAGAILAVIFLLGCHSAFFGPVKFAILPQHLPPHQWSLGNGWIEMGTFAAILLGTNLGGFLMAGGSAGGGVAAGVLAVALAGYGFSRVIPDAPAPSPALRLSRNPAREAWRQLRLAAADRTLLVAMLGNSWFWFFGSVFLTQFPAYTRDTLGGTETVVTLLWTALALAVGAGSLASGLFGAGRWRSAGVPLGGAGMTFAACDLARAGAPAAGSGGVAAFLHGLGGTHVLLDTVLLGLFAGAYIVPLYSLIQARTPAPERARILGTTNFLNALFMVVSALWAMGLLSLGMGIPQLFLATGLLNAAVLAVMTVASPSLLQGLWPGGRGR